MNTRPRVSALFFAGLLFAATLAEIFLSPKWLIPAAAWIAPGLLLAFYRHANVRFRTAWFFLALTISQLIGSYEVVPFPLPVLAIVSVIGVVKVWLVYALDRQISRKSSHFLTTLVFPAAFVTKEYFDLMFSGGAWWSIGNTQYGFSPLAQLASVTGLEGISFLIYWFAAIMVWSAEKYARGERISKVAWIYPAVFLSVVIFGVIRLQQNTDETHNVRTAGITVPTISILENVYKDVRKQDITIDPRTSPSSSQLQQVNETLVPFIEDPEPARFTHTYDALNTLYDSLFVLSGKAADKGAQLIEWSEGNAILPASLQNDFIKRGQDFALRHHVYLLMALAVFEPGKLTPDRLFLENKTVFVSPAGQILNIFHKNHPVPFAERSKPGDGKIPAIKTSLGTVSMSICYDADMPADMRQLGRNKSDVLLLPSGDWYAIAPFHSYMAVFRGIENGCTVVRQANGGLSLATDYRGRQLASLDYFTGGEKIWVADLPFGHVDTVYNHVGDWLPYACIVFSGCTLIYLVIGSLKRKREKRGLYAAPQGNEVPAETAV